MEPISRRSVMGIAAGVLAGGVLAGESVAHGASPSEKEAEAHAGAGAKT
jgi:hypothetical protein